MKGKLPKTLTAVLSAEVIYEVNVDGVQQKSRLKDYTNFYDAVLDAIGSQSEGPETELRKALHTIKSRCHHKKCVQKKAQEGKNAET